MTDGDADDRSVTALDIKMERNSKGKHRWLIVLGGHVSMVVCSGTYRCFGILLVELRRYFDTSLTEVSAIGSILACSFLLAGLMSGSLITRFGCHVVTFVGSVVIVTGTIGSVFAQSALTLCFTLGLVAGVGVGLVYASVQVITAQHFKKGYSRANSAVSSGVGVGIIVMPPVLQLGIDHYGWRGSLLLMAGMQAHLLVVACIFRPGNTKKPSRTSNERRAASESEKDMQLAHQPLNDGQTGHALDPARDLEVSTHGTSNGVKNVEYLPRLQSSPQDEEDLPLETERDEEMSLAGQTLGPRDQQQPSCLHRLLRVSGWGLFKENVGFTLVMICQVMQGLCLTAIFSHFVASVVYAGVAEQTASFLISVIGIGSLVSRVCNGWFIDKKLIAPEHLCVFSLGVLGGSAVLSRAWSAYGWQVVMALLFGLSSGAYKSLVVVVLRKFLGVERLAAAMGINMVFMAVGDLVGPVFAGALYDAANSYNVAFIVAGTLVIASASLLLLERPLRRCKERRHAVTSPQIDDEERRVEGSSDV